MPASPSAPKKARVQPAIWVGGIILLGLILLGVFLLRGGGAPASVQPTATSPQAVSLLPTSITPSPEPARTSTPAQPLLVSSPTALITLTPTGIAFSPTPSLPLTPLTSADGVCPAFQSDVALQTTDPQGVLAFLDAGGASEQLMVALQGPLGRQAGLTAVQVATGSLLGEKTHETVVNLQTATGSQMLVYACQAGEQVLIAAEAQPGDTAYVLQALEDLNKDGRLELIRYRQAPSNLGLASEFSILEWSGGQFRERVDWGWFEKVRLRLPPEITDWSTYAPNALPTFRDVNGDGRLELLVQGGVTPGYPTCETLYQRTYTDTLVWDGSLFQFADRTYAPPFYRYEAALDGDVQVALEQYDRALESYREIIYNAGLVAKNWLPKGLEFCSKVGKSDIEGFDPRVERSQLEAYARWRLLLVYALQGHPDGMQVAYDALKKNFPSGVVGNGYVQVADAFWKAYQADPDIPSVCRQAVDAAQSLNLTDLWREPGLLCVGVGN